MTDVTETIHTTNYHHRCGHPLLMELDKDDGGPNWFDRERIEGGNHRVSICPTRDCRRLLPQSMVFLQLDIGRGDIAKDKERQ